MSVKLKAGNKCQGYILTKRTALDLREIYNYSADQWGEDRARKYLADIYKAFQRMADNPEIGESLSAEISSILK